MTPLPSVPWTFGVGLRRHARRTERQQRPLRRILARLLLLFLDLEELLRESTVLYEAGDDVTKQPLIPALLRELRSFSAAAAPLPGHATLKMPSHLIGEQGRRILAICALIRLDYCLHGIQRTRRGLAIATLLLKSRIRSRKHGNATLGLETIPGGGIVCWDLLCLILSRFRRVCDAHGRTLALTLPSPWPLPLLVLSSTQYSLKRIVVLVGPWLPPALCAWAPCLACTGSDSR